MRRRVTVLLAVLGAGGASGCGAHPPLTLPQAATHPDRRYALHTASDTIVVDSLRLRNDSVVARRPPIRPDLAGTEVRVAAAEVRSIEEVHPDRTALGLTALAMAPLLIFGLVFALGYGSD
ncbi:MAG TPA: hypothetical protein VG940_01045 [Gemmatimonadales bacterium]|nr:hypothetical protein [Gemmatimonadales bacterium]